MKRIITISSGLFILIMTACNSGSENVPEGTDSISNSGGAPYQATPQRSDSANASDTGPVKDSLRKDMTRTDSAH
jgi:hypothetical protein